MLPPPFPPPTRQVPYSAAHPQFTAAACLVACSLAHPAGDRRATDMPLASPSAKACLTVCYSVPATASLPTRQVCVQLLGQLQQRRRRLLVRAVADGGVHQHVQQHVDAALVHEDGLEPGGWGKMKRILVLLDSVRYKCSHSSSASSSHRYMPTLSCCSGARRARFIVAPCCTHSMSEPAPRPLIPQPQPPWCGICNSISLASCIVMQLTLSCSSGARRARLIAARCCTHLVPEPALQPLTPQPQQP